MLQDFPFWVIEIFPFLFFDTFRLVMLDIWNWRRIKCSRWLPEHCALLCSVMRTFVTRPQFVFFTLHSDKENFENLLLWYQTYTSYDWSSNRFVSQLLRAKTFLYIEQSSWPNNWSERKLVRVDGTLPPNSSTNWMLYCFLTLYQKSQISSPTRRPTTSSMYLRRWGCSKASSTWILYQRSIDKHFERQKVSSTNIAGGNISQALKLISAVSIPLFSKEV